MEACADNVLYQQLDSVMEQYGRSPDSLIQVLHRGQELFGYLPEEVLQYVAKGLRIPISKVYGVVTFYSFFTTVPKGKHTIMLCLGTACYVKGAERILQRLRRTGRGVGANDLRPPLHPLGSAVRRRVRSGPGSDDWRRRLRQADARQDDPHPQEIPLGDG